MDELIKAIEAAGAELIEDHDWSLGDDNRLPVMQTLFGQVLLKHLTPIASPEAQRATKRA